MPEKRQFELFFLQYVPRPAAGEIVNIGIVVKEALPGEFARAQFTRDWGRVRCLDPGADIEMLEAIAHDVEKKVSQSESIDLLMRKVRESLSNTIQLSASGGLLTDDPEKELKMLGDLFLDRPHVKQSHQLSGRQQILQQMVVSLEQAGVIKHMNRDISMTRYTKPGDPLKLDFEYIVNNNVKFLHAVSLRGSTIPARLLGPQFPEISAAIKQKTGANAFLTAVVDDDLDRSNVEIGFALEKLTGNGVQIAARKEMPEIAQAIRIELGL